MIHNNRLMKVFVSKQTKLPEWQKDRIRMLFEPVGRQLGVPETAELSITFTTDARMRHLNKSHRNVDSTTDVLAFALLESAGRTFSPETVRKLYLNLSKHEGIPLQLGDILISVNQAKRQAHDAGNTLDAEIAMLLIHGLLHLVGYDDSTEKNRQRMWKIQDQLMNITHDIWNVSSISRKGE